jgi:hypothetical protein
MNTASAGFLFQARSSPVANFLARGRDGVMIGFRKS